MSESLIYQIAITCIKGIGPGLSKSLIAYIGSAEGVFQEKQKNLEKIPGIGSILSNEIITQRTSALLLAENEIKFIEKNKLKTYYYTEENYPFRLTECCDAPVMLYGKGNPEINKGRFIAVVGTRNATDTGKENCKKFISDISGMVDDITIVSGLAYGVDICAHKSALECDMPTIGVLAHGLGQIYPSVHRSISNQMLERGGLLTEFRWDTKPDRPNFVQRNRIIAGLCDAIVVIESKDTGGALITANMANDYNRDVFAYPGRINDEVSKGCNSLIKNNKASLIESAQDLIDFMNWERKSESSRSVQTSLFNELNIEEQEIILILRQYPDGIQTNQLAVLLSKPFSKISSTLLKMEFNNLVKCLPGNIYRIVK